MRAVYVSVLTLEANVILGKFNVGVQFFRFSGFQAFVPWVLPFPHYTST